MRKYLFIFCHILLLVSCSEKEMDLSPSHGVPAEEEEQMGSIELTLTGERKTRATTTTISKEQADNFLITIYKGSDIYRETALLKNMNTRLSAGYGYKVAAESCSEATAESSNDGWGERRYAGTSAPFAVKAGQTTPVSVNCSVANAGIAFVFDETVSSYFTGGFRVSITEGSRNIVFDRYTGGLSADGNITQDSQVAYYNVGEDGTRTITYNIHAESPRKTLDRDIVITLTKAAIERLTINYEMSTFSFNITIDEEELLVDDDLYITDNDIKTDQGDTDMGSTHDGYSVDDANIDINNYD